jgi:hypothetical protein
MLYKGDELELTVRVIRGMDRKTEPGWTLWRRDQSLHPSGLEFRFPGSLAIPALIVQYKTINVNMMVSIHTKWNILSLEPFRIDL